MTDALHSVLGSGVFNTNGDLWRFHRNMSRPFFTKERLRGMIPVFVSDADKALDKLLGSSSSLDNDDNNNYDEEEAVDMQDLASKFTLDAATEFLFGSCVHSLDGPLPRPWNTRHSTPPQTPSGKSRSVDKVGYI
jgi:cytochrome P450